MYKFIVVPRNQFANEIIAATLALTCDVTGNETIFEFNGVEKMGYYVDHSFITRLKNNNDARLKYDLFEQYGNLGIRKYGIPKRKDPRKVKEVKERLQEMVSRKMDS